MHQQTQFKRFSPKIKPCSLFRWKNSLVAACLTDFFSFFLPDAPVGLNIPDVCVLMEMTYKSQTRVNAGRAEIEANTISNSEEQNEEKENQKRPELPGDLNACDS